MPVSETKPGHAKKVASDSKGQQEFIENLNESLQLNATVSTGRVHLIGLEKVKSRLGDKWDRMKDKAHQIVRTIIEDRISPHDMYTLYKDLSYLVVFADLHKDEAQLKCSLIAQEISNRLIGTQKAVNFTDISTLAAKEDGEVYFQVMPSIDDLAGKLEEISKKDNREAAQNAIDVPISVVTDFETIRHIFRPLWQVRAKIVSTFICVPIQMREDGSYVCGYDVLADPTNSADIARLDIYNLKATVRELIALHEQDKPALLSTPVHFETLAGLQRRIDFANLSGRLLDGIEDHMVFELVEMPEGVPQARIADFVGALRPHARAVTAKFSIDHTDFESYKTAGLHAVGVDIYADTRKEAEIMRLMDRFVELANKNDLKTYIHGVNSLSLRTAAITSGFDYIDGYALTSVVEKAEGAYPLDLEASYRPLLDKTDFS